MKDTTLTVVEGSSETPACDVVFFHGLMGDPRTTWEGKGSAGQSTWWPQWPVEDFEHVRVWMAAYDTSFDAMLMPAMSMPNIANAFFDLAELKGLGQRPLLWVGHSMGGLVIKQVLRLATDHSKPEFKALAQSTRAIQFLGTPHHGSTAANLGVAMREMLKLGLNLATGGASGGIGVLRRVLGGSKQSQLDELERNSPALLELQDWFSQWAAQQGNRLILSSYYETLPTDFVKIVDESSGRLGMATARNVARNRDHIGICKFNDREDTAYLWLCRELDKFSKRKLRDKAIGRTALLPDDVVGELNSPAATISVRQLEVATDLFSESVTEVDSFWRALVMTRDKVDNTDVSIASRVDLLRDMARLPEPAARATMWWIQRALDKIPKDDGCRPAAQKAAVALYMLCACRWISTYAETIGIEPGRVARLPRLADITCAVITTALYGGELRLCTAEGGSSAKPEFVFNVSVPDGECSEALFERALYAQLFPTDESVLEAARRDVPLSDAEKADLVAEIYQLRKVKQVAFAFVLSFPRRDFEDASYRIIHDMTLPVFRFDDEVGRRVMGLPNEDLKAEVNQLWRRLVNWTNEPTSSGIVQGSHSHRASESK